MQPIVGIYQGTSYDDEDHKPYTAAVKVGLSSFFIKDGIGITRLTVKGGFMIIIVIDVLLIISIRLLNTPYDKVNSRASIVSFSTSFPGFTFRVCEVELLLSIGVMIVSKTVMFGLPKLEGSTSLDMGMFSFLFEKIMYDPRKASFEHSEQDAQVFKEINVLNGLLGSKGAVHVVGNEQHTEKTKDVIAYRHIIAY